MRNDECQGGFCYSSFGGPFTCRDACIGFLSRGTTDCDDDADCCGSDTCEPEFIGSGTTCG
jgi:hypothetical protein